MFNNLFGGMNPAMAIAIEQSHTYTRKLLKKYYHFIDIGYEKEDAAYKAWNIVGCSRSDFIDEDWDTIRGELGI